MPAPETIDDGLADGTYKHAHNLGGGPSAILSGGVDDYGEYANVGYYVPFEYRRDFIRQALGVSDGDSFAPQPPRECEIAGCEGMYPFGCTWQSTGTLVKNTDGDPISYSDVLVTLQYRTPFYSWDGISVSDPFYLQSISPDPVENTLLLWATQEVDTVTETIRLPDRNLVWGGGNHDGEAVDTPMVRHTGYFDLAVTFQRVPFIPRGLAQYVNHLNYEPFLGFDVGKVWFRGYRTELKSWVGGIRTRSVQLRFAIRPEADWNRRLDRSLAWNRVHLDGDPDVMTFPYANMNNVLNLQFLAQHPI